jgi:predicted AlkP superfamily phosphohydrolase/phosphomutase
MIGLDGTPCTTLKEMLDAGIMPNFKSLVGEGTLCQMDASTPAISSISWTSFMTGKNPAKHRIFGFIDLEPGSYEYRFPNYHDMASETLWDVLGKSGRTSIVINQPSTYPAKPLNGISIAGFVAIDLKKAVYPPSILPKLEKSGYRIDVDSNKAHDDIDAFIKDLFDTLDRRTATIHDLYDNEKWDYFQGVITGTDRLHHFLWSAYDDPNHKFHEAFLEYYRRVDKFIGEIAEKAGDNTTLMLMSDHGFTSIKREIAVNQWLREQGYLKFDTEPPDSLADMSPESRAFALDPSRIFINTKGRFPRGSVPPEQVGGLVAELVEKCSHMNLPDAGEEIVERADRKEDVYDGPYLQEAADIILTPKWHFDMKGTVKRLELATTGVFTGMHTHDDAFFYVRRGDIRDDRKVNVVDLAPTILAILGAEVPADMDGTVLLTGQ